MPSIRPQQERRSSRIKERNNVVQAAEGTTQTNNAVVAADNNANNESNMLTAVSVLTQCVHTMQKQMSEVATALTNLNKPLTMQEESPLLSRDPNHCRVPDTEWSLLLHPYYIHVFQHSCRCPLKFFSVNGHVD
jgi:hypothetical protein